MADCDGGAVRCAQGPQAPWQRRLAHSMTARGLRCTNGWHGMVPAAGCGARGPAAHRELTAHAMHTHMHTHRVQQLETVLDAKERGRSFPSSGMHGAC